MELYEACAANDYAKVQDLISAGANSINFINVNDDNKTALHVAAEHLNEQIVQLLIRNGAEVSVSDRIGLTPFSRACLALGIIPHDTSLDQKELSCLRILAQFDSPILSLDQYGNTVIHVLASRGTAAGFMLICTEIASFLSTKKIDVNPTTSNRNRHKLPPDGGSNSIDEEFLFTMECAWNIDPVVALILLPGWGFLTPLHLAADSGNAALLQTMLKHMKEKNFSYCQPFDALGWTPLHWAAMRNHRPCISTLVKIGGPKLCDRQDFMSRTPVDICFSFAHEATASWMLRRFVKDTDNRQSPPIDNPSHHNKALICFAAILTVCAGSEISLRALLLSAASKSWLALSLSLLIPPGIWWLLTTRNLALAFPLCLAKYGAIKTSMSAMPWQAARSVRRTVLNQHTADEQPCAVRADLRKEWHALWTQLHEWRNDPLLCAYLWWLQSHLIVENQQRHTKTKDIASANPTSSIDRGPAVKASVGQHASTYETYTSESSDSEDTTDPAHVIEIINQTRSQSSLSATSSSESDYTGGTDDPSSSDINLSNSDPRIATAILMSTTSEDDTDEIRTDRLMSSSSESSSSSEESSSPSNRPMAPIALKARLREMLSGGLAMTKGTVKRVLPSPPPLQRYRSADKGAAGGATTGESTDNSASSSSMKTTSDLATSEPSSSENSSNTILSSLNASRESSGPWAPSSWLPGAAVGSAFRHSPSTTTNESNTKHGVEITFPSTPLIGAEAGNLLRWWRAAAQAAASPSMSQTLNDELSLKWKQTPHFGSSWTGFDPATKSMSVGSIGKVKNPLLRQLAERWLTETSLEEGFVLWRAEFINLCKFVNEVPHLFCRIPNIVAASPDQQHRWMPPPRAPSPLAPDKLIQILRTRNPGIPENEIALASVLPFALKADSFSVLGEVVDLMRAEVCLRSTTSAAFSQAPEPPFTDIDVCHWKLFKPAQNSQQIIAEVWLPCVLDIAVALTVISLAEFPHELIGVVRVAYLKIGTLVLLLGQIVSLVIWTLIIRAKYKATLSVSR